MSQLRDKYARSAQTHPLSFHLAGMAETDILAYLSFYDDVNRQWCLITAKPKMLLLRFESETPLAAQPSRIVFPLRYRGVVSGACFLASVSFYLKKKNDPSKI